LFDHQPDPQGLITQESPGGGFNDRGGDQIITGKQ